MSKINSGIITQNRRPFDLAADGSEPSAVAGGLTFRTEFKVPSFEFESILDSEPGTLNSELSLPPAAANGSDMGKIIAVGASAGSSNEGKTAVAGSSAAGPSKSGVPSSRQKLSVSSL